MHFQVERGTIEKIKLWLLIHLGGSLSAFTATAPFHPWSFNMWQNKPEIVNKKYSQLLLQLLLSYSILRSLSPSVDEKHTSHSLKLVAVPYCLTLLSIVIYPMRLQPKTFKLHTKMMSFDVLMLIMSTSDVIIKMFRVIILILMGLESRHRLHCIALLSSCVLPAFW